jgi:hypothetical protein
MNYETLEHNIIFLTKTDGPITKKYSTPAVEGAVEMLQYLSEIGNKTSTTKEEIESAVGSTTALLIVYCESKGLSLTKCLEIGIKNFKEALHEDIPESMQTPKSA